MKLRSRLTGFSWHPVGEHSQHQTVARRSSGEWRQPSFLRIKIMGNMKFTYEFAGLTTHVLIIPHLRNRNQPLVWIGILFRENNGLLASDLVS